MGIMRGCSVFEDHARLLSPRRERRGELVGRQGTRMLVDEEMIPTNRPMVNNFFISST